MASLTRKFLEALGVDEKAQDQIMEKHSEVLNEIKTERDKFKEDAEKLPEVQKQLDELKTKVDESGENTALTELQGKYDKLEAEYKSFKADVTSKETKAKKEASKKELLKEAGISDKFIDLIMKASADDIDSYEFDEDGKTVKDADKKKEAYQKAYADFVVKKGTEGAESNNPPASNGGGSAPSRAAELFRKHSAEMYGTKSKED